MIRSASAASVQPRRSHAKSNQRAVPPLDLDIQEIRTASGYGSKTAVDGIRQLVGMDYALGLHAVPFGDGDVIDLRRVERGADIVRSLPPGLRSHEESADWTDTRCCSRS